MTNKTADQADREGEEDRVDFDETIFDVMRIPYDENKYGRRTKCTEELIKEIGVRIARDGSSNLEAALLSGIHEMSFYRWMQRGRTEHNRLIDEHDVEDDSVELADSVELPFLLLFQTVNKAIPIRKATLVQRIRKAGEDPRNWTANAWLLERMHPDEFGRKTRLEIKQIDWRDEVIELIKQGVEFDTVMEKIGEDEARQLFERASVAVPGVGTGGEAEGTSGQSSDSNSQ